MDGLEDEIFLFQNTLTLFHFQFSSFVRCYRTPPYCDVLPIKIINKIKDNLIFFFLRF